MWANGDLKKKDWCKGIITREQRMTERRAKSITFTWDQYMWPEWCMPHLREEITPKKGKDPKGRVVLITDMSAPLNDTPPTMVFGGKT